MEVTQICNRGNRAFRGTGSNWTNARNGATLDVFKEYDYGGFYLVAGCLFTASHFVNRACLQVPKIEAIEGMVVSSAKLYIYVTAKGNGGVVSVVRGNQSQPLLKTDWDGLTGQSEIGGSLDVATATVGAYNAIELNAAAIAWLNQDGAMRNEFESLDVTDRSAYYTVYPPYATSMSFTPVSDCTIKRVALNLYKAGTGGGTVTINIKLADANHFPTGAALATVSFAASLLPTALDTWYEVALDAGGTNLTGGVEYCIEVSNSSGNASNYVGWNAITTAVIQYYPKGQGSVFDGANWNISTFDIGFAVFDDDLSSEGTLLCLRGNADIGDTAPPAPINSTITFHSAQKGSGYEPYIEVEYEYADGPRALLEAIDITDYVLAAHTERGWDEELAQATAGICELTCDNRNGDFSPENADGAFYGDLHLGAKITFFEIYLGVRYNHFIGRIEKILPHAEHDNQVAYIMTLDGMDDIAATTVSTILRTNTDTGELADDVLDACKWPAGDRDIDTGVDTLDAGWFHKRGGLEAFRDLELTEKGRFFIKPTGIARFENRHYRITGDGLVSQGTFDETMVELGYEYSKRLLYNEILLTGARYFAGGIQLFSGYDLGTIDDDLMWSAHTGDAAAPYIPQNTTVVIWAEFNALLSSYDTLVKGTHWNANTAADKTGADVSDNITITETQYGQAVKLSIANAGSMGAYLVVPDSPPAGAPSDRTLLIYGVLFSVENITFVEENTTSQDDYGKRTLNVKAPFKSKPNDLLAYAQWLLARFEEPIPTPIFVKHAARTAWPDDTIRIQCLSREISDRITLASSKLGFNRDFYINKVIQEYVFLQAGMVHETTWIVERAEGSAEGLYWLLGVADFGELGDATRLGF